MNLPRLVMRCCPSNTSNKIAREKLEEKIESLEIRIKQAEAERKEIEINEKDIKSFVKYVRYVMEHPAEILTDNSDLRAQRALFGLVFEEMPTYQQILNGTPKLSLVSKLSNDFAQSKSQFVS